MMSEIQYLLRLLAPGNRQVKITQLEVATTPVVHTSQIIDGSRKRMMVQNLTNVASGEVYWGASGEVSVAEGAALPKYGSTAAGFSDGIFALPIGPDVDVEFIMAAGKGDLRIIEVA